MISIVRKLFTDHPASVEESYGEHAAFAFGFSLRLFKAAFAALVHAIIPGLCQKTASTIVQDLAEKTKGRGAATGTALSAGKTAQATVRPGARPR